MITCIDSLPSIAPTGIETWDGQSKGTEATILQSHLRVLKLSGLTVGGGRTYLQSHLRVLKPYYFRGVFALHGFLQSHLRVLKLGFDSLYFVVQALQSHLRVLKHAGVVPAALYVPFLQSHLRVLKLLMAKLANLTSMPSIAPTGIETHQAL